MKFFEFESPPIRNTCVILSLCSITGFSWEKIILLLRARMGIASLKDFSKGMTDEQIQEALQALGLKYKHKEIEPVTLNQFAKKHKRGKYLLCTYNHAFVLIDGEVGDISLRPKCKIVSFYEIKD